MKKRILVTGGTGYIGSHTVVELQQSGYKVVIVDNLSNSYAEVVDSIGGITGEKPAFEKFDLCDRQHTFECFKKYGGFDAVIHFAAFKAVGESVEKPLMYFHNNLLSLLNLLEAMKKYQTKALVFSSSCTVYGQPDKLPVTEEAPFKKAWSPYGKTKQMSEEIIADHAQVSELEAISLRYFNPIGSHESALIGEYPIGTPNNLVPYITQTAIGKHEYLKVYGSDYDTPDGTAIRDYIHVVDLAKAHVVAVNRLLNNQTKEPYEYFNLGTGNGFSVLEVIKSFEKVSGVELKYKIVERRQGDVEKVWADTTFANNELGWRAQKGLDEMMLSAWNWELALAGKRKGQ